MKPIEYIKKVKQLNMEEHSVGELKNVFKQGEKTFFKWFQSMEDKENFFSIHDSLVKKVNLNRSGILQIIVNGFVFSKEEKKQEDYYQEIEVTAKLKALNGGIFLSRNDILIDMVADDDSLAIAFLDSKGNYHEKDISIEIFNVESKKLPPVKNSVKRKLR